MISPSTALDDLIRLGNEVRELRDIINDAISLDVAKDSAGCDAKMLEYAEKYVAAEADLTEVVTADISFEL